MALAIAISFVAFLALVGTIGYYGYRVYARPGRIMERLTEPAVLIDSAPMPGEEAPAAQTVIRIIEQVGEKLPIAPADADMTRRYLIAAGFRSDNAVRVYYGIKAIMAVVLLILALLVRDSVTASPILRVMLLFAGGLAGWFGPGWMLERLVAKRQERLRLSLPDALDLMVVCAEAGLGLDQAFVNVSRELQLTHKDICEEFALVNLEMRAGTRRADAMHNLAERTGEGEIQKLVSILVQADKFGTSIAESLRTHADFMRIRRRQEAEERAGKVGVKLVFPIFFCILPSMLIVTAGPGLLQILKVLFPMMKQFRM